VVRLPERHKDATDEELLGQSPCRVFIIDDDSIVAHGLLAALSKRSFIDVVGTARNQKRTVELIQDARPHVVITTAHQGIVKLIEQVRRLTGDSVAVLTVGEPGPLVIETPPAGACGTLPWRVTVEQVSLAVLAAARDTRRLSAPMAGQLTHSVCAASKSTVRLSSREIQVLQRAADGQTNSRIARALSLSEATVKTYWQRIFKKLKVHDRTMAVTTAIAQGSLTVVCRCAEDGPRVHSRG
jgi:DNA-binding NarL/FixJ family response regulator